MSVAFSHVTGNTNSKQAALCLAEHGLLTECHTCLSWNGGMWGRLLFSGKWNSLARRRRFPDQVVPFLKLHPTWELVRLIVRSKKLDVFQKFTSSLRNIENVAAKFDQAVARSVMISTQVTSVYAYMDAAEQSFLAARRRGFKTIYELPTPYWRLTQKTVLEEKALQPDWAATLPALDDNNPQMMRRDRELQLADLILVPSDFVRDSLAEAKGIHGDIQVVPYGGPEPLASLPVMRSGGPLRILFVGSLNQGKGLSYLDQAMKRLGPRATLTVIGARTSEDRSPALDSFLAVHRHLSHLSQDQVLEEMTNHDVLVLPTLYEGLALVMLEACSRGLAVVATPQSGIENLLKSGLEAKVIPMRDAHALTAALDTFATDPTKLQNLRKAAWTASRRLSWEQYRFQLATALSRVLA